MKLKSYILQSQLINFKIGCCLLFIGGLLFGHISFAATDYSIAPLVIEHTVEPRSMFEENIKITNTSSRKLRIFPTVNQITLGEEGEILEFIPPSMADNSTNVTSWISVTRGRVEVGPGETIKVPVQITVDPTAEPGEYYAFLGLAEGTKRDDAQAAVDRGTAPGVIIRLEMPDTKNESLRLSAYHIERFVLKEERSALEYQLENTGDTPITPTGEIILYDVRGNEVGSLPVNPEGMSLSPGEKTSFSQNLPEIGWIGKFKSFLSIKYGDNNSASIYDTVYFTLVPLPALLLIFVSVLGISILLALRFHNNRSDYDDDDEAVSVFVRTGINSSAADHDINLKTHD